MLTRRGWSMLSGALALAVGGRLFGIVELYVMAAIAAALVIAAVFAVASRSVSVDTSRTLHPPRVHAGTQSRVELEIQNVGSRRSPVLLLRDPFDRGWRWARFLVAPLQPRASRRAAYRLPTQDRGVYDVGPLEISVTDPFGLTSRSFEAAPVTQLTVYPRIDRVQPLPHAQGYDPHAGSDHPTALIGGGEDFYALRAYELGDDTRRVHWPSTARVDELMIRQDEMPWQSRATILLDVRHGAHSEASLELAVSAAASIHSACRRRGSLVRLVTTDGTDSGFAAGHAHAEAVLEHLATVRASRTDRFAGVVASLRRAGNGGALAVVAPGDIASGDLDALLTLRPRYGAIFLVLIERSAWDPSAAARRLRTRPIPPVGRVIRVTGDEPFAESWNYSLATVGARR